MIASFNNAHISWTFLFNSPVYWGILDLTGTHPETKQLFSTDDWTEMLKSFEDEIETIEEDIPDVVYLFFDEIEQVSNDDRCSITFGFCLYYSFVSDSKE